MTNIKFSFIVPIYKVEKYLKKCVDSILDQDYSNIEIILVDDGSPDSCPEICDSYKKKDNRISVIHKENGGLSDARNYGIKSATGDYILFIDSDDEIKINACTTFYKYINLSVDNPDILIGQLENVDGSNYCNNLKAKEGAIYSGEILYSKFGKNISSCVVASCYRREFIIENNLFFKKGIFHEDNEFTPRAYLLAKKVIYTHNSFYIRQIREESITTRKDKRKNILDIITIIYSYFEYLETNKNKKVKKVILNEFCNCYLSLFYEGNVFQYQDYKNYIDKKIVMKTAKSFYNRLRKIIFLISPKLYCIINKMFKRIGRQL